MPRPAPASAMKTSGFLLVALFGIAAPAGSGEGKPGGGPKSNGHWAFQAVQRVSPPPNASGWADHPIDRFISAQHRAARLKPARPADRRTLVRRMYFDLIGLPPTPEEIRSFEADDSPDAFVKLVERLLASPHYGERWGRHWMDVVRYADTAGDNADYPIPEIHLYRDYIIDSFNADKPYDQFVREQLAGDILARDGPRAKYSERLVATGFLALSRRYGTGPYELWPLTIEDTIDTTGQAFLGLSLRCARCHDHKYDPVTTEDYYGLYGFFASTQYPWAGAEELHSKKLNRMHFVPRVPPDEALPRLTEFQATIERQRAAIAQAEKDDPAARLLAELDAMIESLKKVLSQPDAPGDVRESQSQLAELERQRADAQRKLEESLASPRAQLRNLQRPGLPAELPGAYAVQDGKPIEMFVHLRGDERQRGSTVPRTVPRFLNRGEPLSIPENSSGRLQLAEWLTRPDHPLTARVMVNRIWQYHFGKGIVLTPSNFGVRGEPPTHPELLDWLTTQFVASGWSVKAMHRLILTSNTYQLSSESDAENAALDPGNRWYWRADRRRLDAESLRDAMLAVADQLDRNRPGGHPFPEIATWSWTQHNPFKEVYASEHRSVYLMTQRIQRHPYLALFDGPDPNSSTDARTSATVPLQALYMMNNPFVHDRAAGLARRVIGQTSDPQRRVALAHELAWGREPTALEAEKVGRYLASYQTALVQQGAAQDVLELEAWTSLARVLLTANEFVYVE